MGTARHKVEQHPGLAGLLGACMGATRLTMVDVGGVQLVRILAVHLRVPDGRPYLVAHVFPHVRRTFSGTIKHHVRFLSLSVWSVHDTTGETTLKKQRFSSNQDITSFNN